MRKFKDVNELVNTLKPDYPVYCIRPESIKTSVEFFKANFPGKVLYAVKTNPNEKVLKQILLNGIENFDVASINEIKLIKKLKPDAKLYFMHTVKSRANIEEAYFKLQKILNNKTYEYISQINTKRSQEYLYDDKMKELHLIYENHITK